jgi:hypothetical protein
MIFTKVEDGQQSVEESTCVHILWYNELRQGMLKEHYVILGKETEDAQRVL